MVDPRVERLERHLIRLRLMGTRNRLNALLEEGARRELSYLDFLDLVVRDEVTEKDAKRAQMRTQMAKFPLNRGLEDYDFALQWATSRNLVHQRQLTLCI